MTNEFPHRFSLERAVRRRKNVIGPTCSRIVYTIATLLILSFTETAAADPFVEPGDSLLRADLQSLDDAGILRMPLTTWPMSYGDISRGLSASDSGYVNADVTAAMVRVRSRTLQESNASKWRFDLAASLAENPLVIRTFEDTPREEAELDLHISRMGQRFAINLRGSIVANPIDGDEFRPDGTYFGVALGNWMLSAGWQERWWGPGNNGSLILSTNARPPPGIAIQRNDSAAFKTKWLSWLGPWSFVAFIDQLDDERYVNDSLLFGARFSFKPISSLEIGLSRVAQFCGDGRPCSLGTFFDMLIGNDNSGVNVDPNDEPGNQRAGIDMRWALPKRIPIAFYMQWIGEDGRQDRSLPPGSWLRQLGAEVWGDVGGMRYTTFFEISDTACHEGSYGAGSTKPNCAYEHGIYQTGYRYKGRSMAFGADADALSYALGSTLVQSSGNSWNVLVRYTEINRVGPPSPVHTLSATPQDLADILLIYTRVTPIGTFSGSLGYGRLKDSATSATSNDISAFIRWQSW